MTASTTVTTLLTMELGSHDRLVALTVAAFFGSRREKANASTVGWLPAPSSVVLRRDSGCSVARTARSCSWLPS